MKRLGFAIVCALLYTTITFAVLSVKPAIAQPSDLIWFWVWRSYDLDVETVEDQRGDLVAFTPDGMVNVLLEDVFPVVLRRMTDSSAFVGSKIGDTYTLYYLTPTQAFPVMELFDQNYVDEFRNYAIYDGFRYYMPQIIPAGDDHYLIADTKRDQFAMFDTVSHATTHYDLRPWCNEECVRVSADGRYIRYRVSPFDPMHSSTFFDPGENALPYQLYEFDTVTQTERLIYEEAAREFDEGEGAPRTDCTPDRYGERWYCALFLDDPDTPVWVAAEKRIIHADCRIEGVNAEWQMRVVDDRWYFLDLDKDRYSEGCDPCVINVYPDGSEADSFQFQMPPSEALTIWYEEVDMLSEQHLMPNPIGSPKYALSRSGELTELGERYCCTDPISFDFYDKSSGYLVSYNLSTSETQIWNTRPLDLIATFSSHSEFVIPGVKSTFRDYSLVVYRENRSGPPHATYSYLDQRIYEFEHPMNIGYFSYIDAFPGGVLLAGHGDRLWFGQMYRLDGDAIYRWTPADGAALVVDGAVPIPDELW